MNAAIDKLNEKLDAKRAEKKRTEEKIAKLQSRIDTEKARLDKLTADAETIEGEIIIQMVRSSDVSLSDLPDILSVYQRSEPPSQQKNLLLGWRNPNRNHLRQRLNKKNLPTLCSLLSIQTHFLQAQGKPYV